MVVGPEIKISYVIEVTVVVVVGLAAIEVTVVFNNYSRDGRHNGQ